MMKTYFLLALLAISASIAVAQSCPTLALDSVKSVGADSVRIFFDDELDLDVTSIEISFALSGSSADDGVITSLPGDSPALIHLPVPGSSYGLYSRSVCAGIGKSDWLGPYVGISPLVDTANCGLSIAIPDDSCPTTTDIPIYVDAGSSASLGTDVAIAELHMIIEHDWPPDVNVWLSNPRGDQIQIVGDLTVGGDDFGNPADLSCSEYVSFSSEACALIDTSRPPYIGTFKPMEDFSLLYDDNLATGLWTLHICDDGELLTGALVHAEIVLTPIGCSPVLNPLVNELGETSAEISWSQLGDCDSVIIEVGPAGFINNYTGNNGGPGGNIFNIPCGADTALLTDLLASTTYDLYFYTWCGGSLVEASCAAGFTTLCNDLSFLMDYETHEICEPSCIATCELSGVFKNSRDDDSDWTVWSGPTPSPGTGASTGAAGTSQYIYTESSTQNCQGATSASLISDCLLVLPSGGQCHLSFSSWIQGRDIGRLDVSILLDTADAWVSLLEIDSAQGAEWISYELNLDNYAGQYVQLRITSADATGARGDICLDEIRLYDVEIVNLVDQVYYRDADGDSYGRDDITFTACRVTAPAGFTDRGGDCNDADSSINPDATEITCNQIDENCNGIDDDFAPVIEFAVDTILIDHPSCRGSSDGMIEVISDTLSDVLTYNWSSGDSTATISDLGEDVYSLTIIDEDGCALEVDTIELIAPDFIDFDITRMIIPSCQGLMNGSISIRPFGGNAPYTVQWEHGPTGTDLTGIGSGSYRALIYDEDSCVVQTDYIELRAPELVLLGLEEARFTTCGGDSSGLLDISVVQGVPPYDYTWNHGEITDRVEKLLPGAYVCTVTDARGCTGISDTFFIERTDTLLALVTALERPSCAGMNDGSLSISGVGGQGPYSILWEDGSEELDRDDLSAGSYDITLSDVNGCAAILDDIQLIEPDSLALDITLTDVTCRGSADGKVSIDITGGTADYQIYWSNGRRNKTEITGLDAGIYSVTVSDASGCKVLSPTLSLVEKNDPLALVPTLVEAVRCPDGSDGTIEIELQSGTAPFIYNWSNGRLDTLTTRVDAQYNLDPGSYDVTVTDDRGCVGVLMDIEVEAKEPISFTIVDAIHPGCIGSSDGVIEVDVSGGTPDYDVIWNDGVISPRRENLPMGTYFFDIEDANDCELDGDFLTLMDPEDFRITTSSQGQSGTSANGIARVNVRGATPPYTILWDDNAGNQRGPAATGLLAGKYAVTITDHRDCVTDTCVTVELLSSTSDIDLQQVIIYPNPTQSSIWVRMDHDTEENVTTSLIDLLGHRQQVSYEMINDRMHINLTDREPGIYILEIYHGKLLVGLEKVIKL